MNIAEELAGAKTVGITGHVRPDGDCVGSCMGLYNYIIDNMPGIQVDVYLEKPGDEFGYINGIDKIKHEADDKAHDVFFVLDCSDVERFKPFVKCYNNSVKKICLDHHVSNEAFADVNYIVPDASSTSELVYNLLDYDKMSLETAEALYMGIAHDTGIFRYSCTSPETMEAAAQLMRKGVDTAKITDRTYYEKTYVQNQILGRALLESIMVLDQRCIVSVVRLKEMEFFQAKPSDLEGIVSQMRQTKGVEVAMFLHETAPQTFKVSLRSKERVDVSRIAKYFGGGGHVRAAGVTMKGSVHDVINNLTALIEKQLDEKIEQED